MRRAQTLTGRASTPPARAVGKVFQMELAKSTPRRNITNAMSSSLPRHASDASGGLHDRSSH
ncbi:hypothetical protein SBA2_260098 [Acidobacteriia bacterium SbA2]|nr:hypothetical protein SBA2_260098 [Acidobacteriia bacterium SbA2]